MSQREALEDAVISQLTPLLAEGKGGSASGYLELVDAYGGSFDPDALDSDLIEALSGADTAVLVTTGAGGIEASGLGGRLYDIDYSLLLLVVSSKTRNAATRHRGGPSGGDPGIYQINEDVHGLLSGAALGVPGVSEVRPQREDVIARSKARHIWLLTYEVVGLLDIDELDDDAGWHTSREVNTIQKSSDLEHTSAVSALEVPADT